MKLSSALHILLILFLLLSSTLQLSSSSSSSSLRLPISSLKVDDTDRSPRFTSLLPTSISHKPHSISSQQSSSNQKEIKGSSIDSRDALPSPLTPSGIPITTTAESKFGHSIPTSYCAPYAGSVCKKQIPPATFVYYNLTTVSRTYMKNCLCNDLIFLFVTSKDDEGAPIQLNERITQNLWTELISPLLEPCKSAAETLLCHYAFPSCSWSSGLPSLKPLCREDCIAVRDLFCFNEWAMVENNIRKGIYFKSRGHFRLPVCEDLPSHGNSTTDPPCTHGGLTSVKMDEVTYTCIKGRGRFYQGPINKTKTGIPCQRWDSQSPHTHNRPPFVFPEIWNSENYCRNAGGEEPVPWCYTSDPKIRWQHCNIPTCGEYHIFTWLKEKFFAFESHSDCLGMTCVPCFPHSGLLFLYHSNFEDASFFFHVSFLFLCIRIRFSFDFLSYNVLFTLSYSISIPLVRCSFLPGD